MAQSAKDRRYAPMNSMIPGDVNFNPAEHMDLTDFGSSDSGASLGDILGAALAKRDDDK